MAIRVEIYGVEEVQRRIGQIADGVRPALQEAIGEAATLTEELAKGYAPVRTGRLRASIKAEVVTRDTVVQGVVGSDVPYAGVQEERVGFLARALREAESRIVDFVNSAIARLIGKE